MGAAEDDRTVDIAEGIDRTHADIKGTPGRHHHTGGTQDVSLRRLALRSRAVQITVADWAQQQQIAVDINQRFIALPLQGGTRTAHRRRVTHRQADCGAICRLQYHNVQG